MIDKSPYSLKTDIGSWYVMLKKKSTVALTYSHTVCGRVLQHFSSNHHDPLKLRIGFTAIAVVYLESHLRYQKE